MMGPRKAPFDRLLLLVRALADSVDGLTLDDMADVLGQKRRSAERARDLISLHFDLDEIEDGRRKRFRIRDSLRRHYVRPNATELAALQAEIAAAENTGSPRADILGALLAKLRASLDDKEKLRIDPDFSELARLQRTLVGPGAITNVSPLNLVAVTQAIMAGKCIEFEYLREDDEEPVWRRVIPHGLLHGTVSYLVGAFPVGGYGLVTYRLDRMSNARVSDKIGAAAEDFDLDEWLAGSFGMFRDSTYEIQLRVLPGSVARAKAWRFHPAQTFEDQPDGSALIQFATGGLQELANHLFCWAGEIVIEGPQELRETMEERLDEARIALGH